MYIIERYFKWKLNLKRIERYIEKINCIRLLKRPNGKIKVSCVQRSIKPVKRVEDYIDIINSFVSKAANEGCEIVAFPEYNIFDLFGMLPGFKLLNRYLIKKTKSENNKSLPSFVYKLLYATSKPIQEAIENIMCLLGKKYGIYIYSGSYFIRENNSLYNAGALISRKGRILGRQKKLHLTAFEEELGIKRGCELITFLTDIGKVACPICMDATYFETFRLLKDKECNIVMIPIANNEEYNLFRAIRGIWARVQESYLFGIKSSLNGWLLGIHFTGKAGVFAPISVTKKQDGIISISKEPEGDSLVIGELDMELLNEKTKSSQYYGDVNHDFEKEYYIKTYKGVSKNEKEF